MEGYGERGDFAGVTALLHRHGELAYVATPGWQDREAQIPMQRDTIFRIASMTKPIVAVATLTLVEEGKLRLFDPLDAWLPELAQRNDRPRHAWESGARLATHLGICASWMTILRRIMVLPTPAAGTVALKKAVWFFIRSFDDLSKQEQEELQAMRQASTRAETIYQLVQEFFRLVRARQGTQLDSWLGKAEASAIPELQRSAHGLKRDKEAVLAGLPLVHSNGMTEGFVNKLKLIKRMGYGRAGFPLLRQRMLHAF